MVSLPINKKTGKTVNEHLIFKARKKGMESGIGAKITRPGSSTQREFLMARLFSSCWRKCLAINY
jgi:hypothetical protein